MTLFWEFRVKVSRLGLNNYFTIKNYILLIKEILCHFLIKRNCSFFQDYRNEFNRTNSTLKFRRERDDLLGSGRHSTNGSLAGLSRRDLYLRESDHLNNSEKMIDEQISIAVETRDHMKGQREAFKLIQTKVNDLSNRFPMINTLMTKINLRERRDSIIIGVVVGLCFTFLLWYMLF